MSRWDLIGVAAIVIFVASIFELLSRQEDSGAVETDVFDPSAEIDPGEEWLGLYFRGRKIGLVHQRKEVTDDGYRYEVETVMHLAAMKTQATLDVAIVAELAKDLKLRAFKFALSGGPASLKGSGTVEGQVVELTLETAGVTSKTRLELASPPVLRVNMGPLLSRLDQAPGKRYRFEVFDPLTQSSRPVDVEVVGPDEVAVMGGLVKATHIRSHMAGLALDGWMNARGEILRQELSMGLVAIRETREEASWGMARGIAEAPDLVEATMIRVEGLPEKLDDKQELVVVLQVPGVVLAERFDLVDRRQSLAGAAELRIVRESVGEGLAIPVVEHSDPSMEAEPLIQADHPEIRSTAATAIAGATDSVTAARRLCAFVHRHLTQQNVVGVPSALEILENRVGDCNEHATLFAALARAVGVPTRVVTGLVYAKGKFGYHAWNEVLTADGWLSVDPTWNQMPADVGHLRFVTGGLGEQVQLLGIVGQLAIDVRTVR